MMGVVVKVVAMLARCLDVVIACVNAITVLVKHLVAEFALRSCEMDLALQVARRSVLKGRIENITRAGMRAAVTSYVQLFRFLAVDFGLRDVKCFEMVIVVARHLEMDRDLKGITTMTVVCLLEVQPDRSFGDRCLWPEVLL